MGEGLPSLWEPLEDRQGKAGDGRIIAVVGHVHAKAVGKHVRARSAGYQPAPVFAFEEIRLVALFHIVGECSRQRGENASWRDDTVEMAVLVMDQCEWHIGRPENDEGVHRVHQIGNNRRRTR